MNAENMATNKKKVYANSFMSYAEEMLIKGKKQGNSSVFFEEYMIKVILNKVRYLIEQKRYSDAKKILREYKHTKYNRKSWLKNYLLSCKYIHALFNKIK
jgi:F0F1-type ATP synthase delta subunit